MKKIFIAAFAALLSGCAGFQANECIFDQVSFCAGQIALENQLNGLLDSIGSQSCVDVVHTCPAKDQCVFNGCGEPGSESGDWQIVVIEDPRK